MILAIKVIVVIAIIIIIVIIIIIIIIVTMIIKCRDRYRTSTATNMELLVTLHNGGKPLSNIKKSSVLHAVRVLCTPLKRLIHQLTS